MLPFRKRARPCNLDRLPNGLAFLRSNPTERDKHARTRDSSQENGLGYTRRPSPTQDMPVFYPTAG